MEIAIVSKPFEMVFSHLFDINIVTVVIQAVIVHHLNNFPPIIS